MLQRASEGEDKDLCEMCLATGIGADKCEAVCGNSEEETTDNGKVKAGDLAVSAAAAEGKKALIGWTSDLDTLTFKTSEEVEISSITLERYGYSTIDDVVSVQLEDEDWNIIADAKELNNKGQVKLSIKKDYRKVDWTYKATVVVNTRTLPTSTTDTRKNGSTIGFKVVDADSTAKNLNLDDYDPYTYDLVSYAWSKVQFSSRNSATKDYAWEADKSYEVAKFRVKAPSDANILVKWFTLTDSKKNVIDADKYAKDVTVTFDGKEVSGLKWSINKDDELVVSFDEVEVEGKKTASIAVNMSFTEEFDNFNQSVQYYIKDITKFNATDKKTGTRVSQDESLDTNGNKIYTVEYLATTIATNNSKWTTYTFKWGKVKLSGSKLGTVNAAANSTNVLIAEWEITITEHLRGNAYIQVPTHSVNGKTYADFIDEIRLVINGEDTIWKVVTNPTISRDGTTTTLNWTFYEFRGLEIEKSGKVEIRVDVKDNAEGTISFPASLNSSSFELKYDESGEEVYTTQLAGSLNISNVKAQAAKASLENKNTKEVELIKLETNRKTIFDGTYEAKKGAITLKNFIITPTASQAIFGVNNQNVTFYVTIDWEEYDADLLTDNSATFGVSAKWDIDDIEVADGKSVNVKVEIEVVPTAASTNNTFNIKLEGEDEDNNIAGEADDDTVKVKAVDKGSLNVNSSAKNTVLLKADRSLAEFTIKPSKSGDDDVTLDNLVFSFAKNGGAAEANQGASEYLKVVVDGDTINAEKDTNGNYTFEYKPEVKVPADWITVKVSLKSEVEMSTTDAWERTLTLTHLNVTAPSSTNTNQSRSFTKRYLPAILKITQEKKGDITKYNIDVERDDSSTTVSKVVFYTDSWAACAPAGEWTNALTTLTNCAVAASSTDEFSDTDNSMQGTNGETAKSITVIAYQIDGKYVIIKKSVYEDYFKVNGGDYLMLFSNK